MTAACKVCEAAHAMCLSGDDGAQAADFLKAAVVQERKAKEAAEAERAAARAELAAAKAYAESQKEKQAIALADLAASRAALAKEREACDNGVAALTAILDAWSIRWMPNLRAAVRAFVTEQQNRRAAAAKGAT